MPRGNKRLIANARKQFNTERKNKKEALNAFKVDNLSETSGDSISLNEKPSTSKQTVQYPSRTFENRNALEALKTGFWKKPDKEHESIGNTKKKPQRKQGKRTYVNFHALNYSDPEDYADPDSYSNGPTMRYVDVARSALCSRSSPTPVQKIQQRAPNLDLQEFPYLQPNKLKNSELLMNEQQIVQFNTHEQDEFHEVFDDSEIENEIGKENAELMNGKDEDDEKVEEEQIIQFEEGAVMKDLSITIPKDSLNVEEQQGIDDGHEEIEELVHPLAFQSLSPYPSSSFVYINPNMGNNFDYVESNCSLPPISNVCNKPSLVDEFCVPEHDTESELSFFSYGAGDVRDDQDLSDTSTIQHSESTSVSTSEYMEDSTSDDDDDGQNDGYHIFTFEWLEMTIRHLSGPFDVVIPNFNYFNSHIDFPRFARQFEDTNYLRLEQRALFGLRLAQNEEFFKNGPYM